MAWVQWDNSEVVGNTLYPKKGAGDNWKELIDEVTTTAVNKKIVIVEEGGKLCRRAEDITFTYAQNRAQEYPHVKNQLDMLYKDTLNGTTTWKDKITEIKDKYPKE